jgi:hypothetical protein
MKLMITAEKKMVFDEASPEAQSLIASSAPQLLERIFTDQFGRCFRMVFMVAVVDGELKGKLVSVQPISEAASLKLKGTCVSSGTICLPTDISNKSVETEYVPSFVPVVSPYVSLEYLMTSQPTRAPSF